MRPSPCNTELHVREALFCIVMLLLTIIYHHISSLDAYLQTSVPSSCLFIDMLRFFKKLSIVDSTGIDPISHLSMLPTSSPNTKTTK